MQTTFRFLLSCLFCFTLFLLLGCGNDGTPTSTQRDRLLETADKIQEELDKEKEQLQHERDPLVRQILVENIARYEDMIDDLKRRANISGR